jgi:hypothetical protein
MRKILALSLCLMATGALADARSDKLTALMDAEGVSQAFDSARTMVREQTRADAEQILRSVVPRLDATPETIQKLTDAVTALLDEVTSAGMTREDMVATWNEVYAAQFTDAELDQLLAFYRSPLGQKTVRISREAMPKVMEHAQSKLQPALKPATEHYFAKVRQIITDCNCLKKESPETTPAAPASQEKP